MPMHEQMLRKEQDPFHKPESEEETAKEHAASAKHRRVEAEEQRVTEQERTHEEHVAPSVVAHLPGQTTVSEEAAKRLFNHFSESQSKSDKASEDEDMQSSSVQTDARTSAHAREPLGKDRRDRNDIFLEGVDGDFVPDSKIAAGELDDTPQHHNEGGGLEGGGGFSGGGRKRRGAGATTTTVKGKV